MSWMLVDGLQLAGFQVSITGRFWVSTEAKSFCATPALCKRVRNFSEDSPATRAESWFTVMRLGIVLTLPERQIIKSFDHFLSRTTPTP